MLSILIPTYNQNITALVYELHKQCLECEIKFEILAQDDYSTDYLDENLAIGALENCSFYKTDKNIGRTATRSLLAEKAQYQWLLFLDADVMPTQTDFIQNYIPFTKDNKFRMILGGYQYQNELPELNKILRYKYGKNFEEKKAELRNKKPYQYVFSGNMLIQKNLFFESNYNAEGNYYGMDIYFAYQLYIKNTAIIHIDNPIYHLGLEDNEQFFNKAMQAVQTRKNILLHLKNIEQISPLLHLYKRLDQYQFTKIIAYLFKRSNSYLRKKILNKNPNLFCFNLYRLGYICSIK